MTTIRKAKYTNNIRQVDIQGDFMKIKKNKKVRRHSEILSSTKNAHQSMYDKIWSSCTL